MFGTTSIGASLIAGYCRFKMSHRYLLVDTARRLTAGATYVRLKKCFTPAQAGVQKIVVKIGAFLDAGFLRHEEKCW
jgi:hypothetical protein